ncbi:poly-gamma-glutamate hydrolase family protein [Rugamonas sp. A1-17]|nr:poly-gamma-glutamate hydrolase family protein [Rugamonas sp. A1-17]
MTDKYRNFSDLTAREVEGRDFRIVTVEGRSGLVILAPHGGKIEPHTSMIARAIAADDHAIFLFEGCKRNGNGDLHVTSENFDEPACLDLVTRSKLAVGVHGKDGLEDSVLVGGRNARAKALVVAALHQFGATTLGPSHLKGESSKNVCNRAIEAGIQLEISRGLRDKLAGADVRFSAEQSKALFTTFVSQLRNALAEY